MILWAFLAGMVACGITLSLLQLEEGAADDKFGSAVAMFAAWCAFGMLLMAGTYGLGLLVPGLTGAAVLVLRKTQLAGVLRPLSPYKMPLGIGALLASVVTWIGVLNLMEDIPNG
ncbi:hypothetical protein [Litoreibacter roseus]|uniref:Uncharacterized protein n=1 Tax=Litoreibacter roseus TaxID=2601869 RepID=A0A6N6JHZ9_9RHOB|nr:hypothetical protein [Litoreibacter roseus]GFE65450.1 hypothetical protein KIN_25240 [Litoreibacter roseus]